MLWEDTCGQIIQIGNNISNFGYVGDESPLMQTDSAYLINNHKMHLSNDFLCFREN